MYGEYVPAVRCLLELRTLAAHLARVGSAVLAESVGGSCTPQLWSVRNLLRHTPRTRVGPARVPAPERLHALTDTKARGAKKA